MSSMASSSNVLPGRSRSLYGSKPSMESSPRIPYDTHAFFGQGDYSELQSPLMTEHTVPLEMLQQVYLNAHQLQTNTRVANNALNSTIRANGQTASYDNPVSSRPVQDAPSPRTAVAPEKENTASESNDKLPEIVISPGSMRIPFVGSFQRRASVEEALKDLYVDESSASTEPSNASSRRSSIADGSAITRQINGLTTRPDEPIRHAVATEYGPTYLSEPPGTNGSLARQEWMSYTPSHQYPPVRLLTSSKRKRILVTGGAGFVGSHLVDRLMFLGHEVTVLDNFFSGAKTAVSHWVGHPHFELVRHDVTLPFHIECDMIYHLACPASPRAYQYNQIKTMKTNFLGTLNMLGLAKRTKARFLLSSTSEVYGSPTVHPQPETYWGNVNPIGPRACYDEGKRVAEALAFGYLRQDGVDVRVARIFNSFGPRMTPGDGRVVSNFILQALRGDDITIYGDGSQTRSLLFVHDLVDGLILLMNSDYTEPVNIGSPYEGTIRSWAELIIQLVDEVLLELSGGDTNALKTRQRSTLVFKPMPEDDPPRRQADTARAKEVLGWEPRWQVKDGLKETIRSFIDSDSIDISLDSAIRGARRQIVTD